ncbi:MAG: hypothetical protein A6F71_02815 [Cycloclasticus sp. symbiont of Poecilosclerida sp. M]|nr:MAG: hypothetical protein A6F71_02815 [Cycloclasticus sp. symbiont of Poecilosclerida sp. M]
MMGRKIALSICVSTFLIAFTNASANDWNVVQNAQINTITLNQGSAAATDNSLQGVNVVNLAAGDTLSNTTQTTDFSGGAVFELRQSGAGNNNVQSVNIARASRLTDITQRVTGFATAQMTQNVTGTNNVQALNYARSTSTAENVTQDVTGGTVTITNTGTPADTNTQALNYLQSTGDASGTLSQSVTLTTLNVIGSAETGSVRGQAANVLLVNNAVAVSASATTNQSLAVGTINITRDPVSTAPVALYLNRIIAN